MSTLQTKTLAFIMQTPNAWCNNIEQASKRGCADILACYNGKSWAIEVKDSKGDNLSGLQYESLRRHALAGGVSCVVASPCNVAAVHRRICQQDQDCKENGIETARIEVLTLEQFRFGFMS